MNEPMGSTRHDTDVDADRRDFIQAAGRFALLAPPTMTFLLSTTLTSTAIAQSCGDCVSGNAFPGGPEDPNGGANSGEPFQNNQGNIDP